MSHPHPFYWKVYNLHSKHILSRKCVHSNNIKI